MLIKIDLTRATDHQPWLILYANSRYVCVSRKEVTDLLQKAKSRRDAALSASASSQDENGPPLKKKRALANEELKYYFNISICSPFSTVLLSIYHYLYAYFIKFFLVLPKPCQEFKYTRLTHQKVVFMR